jgi:hypothetical protein
VARISCRFCGTDVLAARYKDEIEAFKQGLCRVDPKPGQKP